MPLLILLALLLTTPALAETQTYDPTGAGKENPAAEEARKQAEQTAIEDNKIVPAKVNVSLTPMGKSRETVGLRFSVPDVVNGCWDISPLNYTTSSQGPYYFDVTIIDYTRKEGSCSGNNRMASATIPIEKKLLEEGKLKVLRLTIGTTTDKFNVSYQNGTMEIIPASQAKFTVQNTLRHHFGQGKSKGQLIALIVPTAPAHTDTTQAIADFAMMYGLTPAPETATSSLAQTNGGSDIHYYYDAQKTLTPRLNGEFSSVGQTSIPMLYDTQDGRGQNFIPAPVYAKKID